MQLRYQSFQSKRLPNPETWDEPAAARSSLERVWSRFASGWVEGVMVGLAALTVLGLFAFRAPGDCRAPPVAFRPGAVQDVAMTVPRGRACGLAVKISAAQVVALSIDTPPQYGELQPRGRTGATYRPDAAFAGEDFFAVALEGPGALGAAAMLVRVKVVVN
jgi:hypothetical protein